MVWCVTLRSVVAIVLVVSSTGAWAAPRNIFDDDWAAPKRPEPARPVVPPTSRTPVTGQSSPPAPNSAGVAARERPVPVAPVVRLAVPPHAEQAAARKLLKEVFADQLADRSVPARRKLAGALVAEATKLDGAPTDRFVLLAAAVDAFVDAADLSGALGAAGRMAEAYDVDGLGVKADAAVRIGPKPGVTPEAWAENVRAALELTDELAAAGDFGSAARVCAAAQAAVGGSSPPLRARLQERQRELAAAKEASDRIAKDIAKLRTTPDDPAANLAVGRYACLIQGDWDAGPPMLAKGSDPALKAIAARELARPTAPEAVAALADAWWDAAAKQPDPASKAGAIARAAALYARALGGLEGLRKAQVEKRIAEAGRQSPGVAAARAAPKSVAGLAPGLLVTEYAADPSQAEEKKNVYVAPDRLGDPVAAPRATPTLNWKYDAGHNAVARGFIKVDKAGDYQFNLNNFYDRNALYVDGRLVCPYRDGEGKVQTVRLEPGLVPIQSVGAVHARGTVRVKWMRPGDTDLSDVPGDVLFHQPPGRR